MDGLAVDHESSRLPAKTRSTLQYLHDQDDHGQAFRYGTQRVQRKPPVWETIRPEETLIYLESAIVRLHDAAVMLVNGLGGDLDVYEELTREISAEFEAEAGSWA